MQPSITSSRGMGIRSLSPGFFRSHSQRPMARLITNLSASTELEAVNTMLGSIGESLLPANTDLATVTAADVVTAVDLLRKATRAVQAKGWKFNREFGYELPKDGTINWTDTSGAATVLNVFVPPANLSSFRVTRNAAQQSLDLAVRKPRKYEAPLVFYDRALNRDGLDSTRFPTLYIDPVWFFDFEDLPQEAREFITMGAARQFAQRVLGSDTRSQFTAQDELRAWRLLEDAHGDDDDYNILDNTSVSMALGGRPRMGGFVRDRRGTPGPV